MEQRKSLDPHILPKWFLLRQLGLETPGHPLLSEKREKKLVRWIITSLVI